MYVNEAIPLRMVFPQQLPCRHTTPRLATRKWQRGAIKTNDCPATCRISLSAARLSELNFFSSAYREGGEGGRVENCSEMPWVG